MPEETPKTQIRTPLLASALQLTPLSCSDPGVQQNQLNNEGMAFIHFCVRPFYTINGPALNQTGRQKITLRDTVSVVLDWAKAE